MSSKIIKKINYLFYMEETYDTTRAKLSQRV